LRFALAETLALAERAFAFAAGFFAADLAGFAFARALAGFFAAGM
jgi:hypothetical protein